MLRILCVAYGRPIDLSVLIGSIIVQDNPDWHLTICYDGEVPDSVSDVAKFYYSQGFKEKIDFVHSGERNGRWGHPNRSLMLNSIEPNDKDYILITNDDNYYVKGFIRIMLGLCKNSDVGMVFCDTIHSHLNYNYHHSTLSVGGIDMGCFIVRADIATSVGFTSTDFAADGVYATACSRACRNMGLKILSIPKGLFIHN
jgi:hypothetical protein